MSGSPTGSRHVHRYQRQRPSSPFRAMLRVQVSSRILCWWYRLTRPPITYASRIGEWLEEQAELRPGTRVQIVERGCKCSRGLAGRVGTITDFPRDLTDEDYHVKIDGKMYERGDTLYDYICPRSLKVLEYR